MSAGGAKAAPSPGLAGDLWGGLAAALVALPSSIAYGVITYSPLGGEYAAYGALAGILGAIAVGIVAPAFGGARRLISAPCAPAAAMMGALAVDLVSGARGAGGLEPQQVLLLMTLAALMSGALQTAYGSVRGGRLIKYIPYPVVSGYLSGVGLIILSSQIPKFLGTPKGLSLLRAVFAPESWQWSGMGVGAVTIAVMVLAPKLTKAVPAAILGLLAGVGTYFGIAVFLPELRHLDHNHLVIGAISAGESSFVEAFVARVSALRALRLEDMKALLAPALTLSVLLSIDTLKTCVVLDAMTRSRHDSNRELIGQGLANLAAAAIGGMPGAGTSGPTFVNLASGGATKLSGIFEGAFVLAAFLVLGGLISWIPIGALAGILMVVGFRMLDRGSLHLLEHKDTVFDFLVIAAVTATALSVGLIAASGVGLALSILLFIRDQIRGQVIRRKLYGSQVHSKQNRLAFELEMLEQHGDAICVCELQGNLFFGTTDQLLTDLEADLKKSRFVILDMRRVQSVDFTGAHMLEQIEAMLADQGGHLLFSDLPPSLPTGQDLQRYFQQIGLVRPTSHIKVFSELDEALEWAEDRLLEHQGLSRMVDERALDLAEIELTREFDSASIAALRGIVTEQSLQAGETVFKRKDEGDEIYLIRRGMIRILLPLRSGKLHHIATFGRGNFFGDIAFLAQKQRTADAVATMPTEVYLLSRKRFDEFSRRNPEMGVRVFARLAKALALRLRDTDKELRVLQDS